MDDSSKRNSKYQNSVRDRQRNQQADRGSRQNASGKYIRSTDSLDRETKNTNRRSANFPDNYERDSE